MPLENRTTYNSGNSEAHLETLTAYSVMVLDSVMLWYPSPVSALV